MYSMSKQETGRGDKYPKSGLPAHAEAGTSKVTQTWARLDVATVGQRKLRAGLDDSRWHELAVDEDHVVGSDGERALRVLHVHQHGRVVRLDVLVHLLVAQHTVKYDAWRAKHVKV
eukprot:1140499-Pleurochrysis_carterae.AAC.2